jgi:hypothetical protein
MLSIVIPLCEVGLYSPMFPLKLSENWYKYILECIGAVIEGLYFEHTNTLAKIHL